MSTREQILEKIKTIPSMPAAANAVIQLLKDPDVEVNALVRGIEYDQGLTANVLRLANSAYFAGPRTVGSLKEAIVRLGMNRIFQLVLTVAIVPLARQPVRGYDLPAGRLLEQSVAVAIGAEDLAARLDRKAPPHTYTSGLLHDLGKVVLGTFLEVSVGPVLELAQNEQLSFDVAEARVMGVDHAEAGAALLEHWNLPKNISDVVRYHHHPEALKGDTVVVDLVHMADALAIESGLGGGVDGMNYKPSEVVMSRLKVRPQVAEQVVCRMLKELEEFKALMGK
jgi:putative nucleotidyltransferase with HDIG domain